MKGKIKIGFHDYENTSLLAHGLVENFHLTSWQLLKTGRTQTSLMKVHITDKTVQLRDSNSVLISILCHG